MSCLHEHNAMFISETVHPNIQQFNSIALFDFIMAES